jgi:hypothetical protein
MILMSFARLLWMLVGAWNIFSLLSFVQAANDDGNNDDNIQYWGDYTILPKRCIVYNNVDVIVWSMFSGTYHQCSNDPMGTYITPVPYFTAAYLEQLESNKQDQGYDDYVAPDAAAYIDCTYLQIEGKEYYVQLGCTDGTSQSISVNIYTDNTCETKSTVNGYDDANIDVSELKLPFKQCKTCVNWVDVNDDEVDDQFYENHQMQAPLCSTVWSYKESCDRTCQKTGLEPKTKEGWNTPDKILLAILTLFGLGMLGAIVQKRRKMSNKDALLEQAAMSAAGLQQAHVLGIVILVILVIAVFALLGLKNITWALLLIMNTALFGYLLKLTVDSGVSAGETIIGPDGTVIQRKESEDSEESEQSNPNNGTYTLPTLT